MSEVKITKKDIVKAYFRWWFGAELATSYDRMQALGYCYAMAPILKKLYGDRKEEYSAALKRHLVFFNTMAIWGGAILGLTISMEQEKAKDDNVPDQAIIGMKTGLMGPLAGIGDSINHATIRTLFFSVAASVGASGNPVAAFIPFLYCLIDVPFGLYMTYVGYNLGSKSITALLESGWIDRVINGAGILGLFMVGALTANNVSLNLAPVFMLKGEETTVQSIIDKVCPGLLPLLVVLGIYVFFKKKGEKFGTTVLFILIVSLICSFIGLV